MCFNSIGNWLQRKLCFEKQCLRCLACLRELDLHLGKTEGCITSVFCCPLCSWFFFSNVPRIRHIEKIFCSCLRLLCQTWGFCNLNFDLPRQNLFGNCCIVSAVTVHLSRFYPGSFASITMVFGPYSKRWEIVRQCFNAFWTMSIYRMTRANFVNSIIHSKTIWFMQSEVFLTCRGWNSQTIGFVWVFWTRTGKTGFRLTHVYLS